MNKKLCSSRVFLCLKLNHSPLYKSYIKPQLIILNCFKIKTYHDQKVTLLHVRRGDGSFDVIMFYPAG